MMMSAFVTINGGLVPLIESLCGQILYFRFEIIIGLRSHLLLFFFETKFMLKKKEVSPRSHPAFWYIHTYMYFVHISEYMYAEIWSIWILRALQVSRPLGSQPSTPSVHCVCVCAYTEIYTHIHSHPRYK